MTEGLLWGAMKRIEWLLGITAMCALAGVSRAAAPTAALTFPDGGSGISGTLSGGVGWSFVPTTNITLTSVGYLDLAEPGGNPNVVVTLWSGTTNVLASYTGITDPLAPQSSIVTGAIPPLTLTAGKTYTITAHLAPLASSQIAAELYDNAGDYGYNPFEVAPQLSQFRGVLLGQNGVISPVFSPPDDQVVFYLGPTFSFVTGAPLPTLQIQAMAAQTVQLSWSTNAAGFSLQRAPAVTGPYTAVTNVPAVSGANYITTLPATNAGGYFRLSQPAP
jgi:hypothetical protein